MEKKIKKNLHKCLRERMIKRRTNRKILLEKCNKLVKGKEQKNERLRCLDGDQRERQI